MSDEQRTSAPTLADLHEAVLEEANDLSQMLSQGRDYHGAGKRSSDWHDGWEACAIHVEQSLRGILAKYEPDQRTGEAMPDEPDWSRVGRPTGPVTKGTLQPLPRTTTVSPNPTPEDRARFGGPTVAAVDDIVARHWGATGTGHQRQLVEEIEALIRARSPAEPRTPEAVPAGCTPIAARDSACARGTVGCVGNWHPVPKDSDVPSFEQTVIIGDDHTGDRDWLRTALQIAWRGGFQMGTEARTTQAVATTEDVHRAAYEALRDRVKAGTISDSAAALRYSLSPFAEASDPCTTKAATDPYVKLQAIWGHVQAARAGLVAYHVALERIGQVLDTDPRADYPRIEPVWPGPLTMTRDEVLERLCDMLFKVWEKFDPNAHEPNDCFCLKANPTLRFQTSAQALRWVEMVVDSALRSRSETAVPGPTMNTKKRGSE